MRGLGIRTYIRQRRSLRPYIGYSRYISTSVPTKRALLTHLTLPLYNADRGQTPLFFSPHGITLAICRVLNECGYIVDVVNWNDTKFIPRRDYDLFIGHGAVNFAAIKDMIGKKVKTIYFSTGSYWRYHNDQERQRLADFASRNHHSLPPDRLIAASEDVALERSDGIICLGNDAARATYAKFTKVMSLPIATFHDDYFEKNPKDYVKSARGLLFLSGNGNIHKGLDLALEAVRDTDLQLHIITRLDPEFASFYHDDLYNRPNVHFHGSMSVGSVQFREIASNCAYTVLLSCSEGSPGSIADTMMQGLIPIVTIDSHIDTGDFGIMLSEVDLPTIRKQLLRASQAPAADIENRSHRAYDAACSVYSEPAFRRNFETALLELTGEAKK